LALLCWTRDITLSPSDPSYVEMQRIEANLGLFAHIPTLIIWGMQDPVLPEVVLAKWQAYFPHATVHKLGSASHFLQEDEPEQILSLIQKFLI
jgi:cis-3-alkyl-4-acyloxetan-2-one decarboxylase